MATAADRQDMESSRQALRRSLSSSSKGRLQYDRTWERDGRGEEIIADINARLIAISVSPRADIFSRSSITEYVSVKETLSDLSLEHVGSETDAQEKDVSGGESVTDSSEPSEQPFLLQQKVAEFLEQSNLLDDEEERERDIRNRRLSHEPEMRLRRIHSEVGAFMESLLQKSPTPSPSNVSNRLREVECKKKQVQQELEQKKQKELQREVRSLIAAIDGEVRRTVKSLEESVRGYESSLKQHVKESADLLKTLQSAIDSIACKTSFTDEDHQKLCEAKDSITSACSKVSEKTDALIFAAKQQKQQQEQTAVQTSSPHAPQTPAAVTGPPATERTATPAPDVSSVSPADSTKTGTFKDFIRIRTLVTEFGKKVQPFIDDNAQKSYRLRLQQFIRTQINAISPESNDHLKQKFQKLQALFNQQDIDFQDNRLNTRGHAVALDFCLDYAAKTFLSVGSKQVLSVPKAAFSFAAIIALLWEKEERFGLLFLGHLLEKCPYVGCYYPVPDPRASEAENLICCGYVFGPDNESLESEESYLNRMRSYVRIYGALLQSKAQHPHGMRYAWIWMTRTLHVEPKAGISAAVIHAFLDVCLHRLYELYKNQCLKLLTFLASDYLPRIERNSVHEVKKQSIVQLKIFVNDSIAKIRRNKSLKHEGLLSDYFWQKSYLNS